MESDLWYLQDARKFVGNDMLWWCPNGGGYTTDLSKAAVYTKEQAFAQHRIRSTDKPWPKAYIDGKTRPAVDFQYCKYEDAMKGIGEYCPPLETICPHCGNKTVGPCPRSACNGQT